MNELKGILVMAAGIALGILVGFLLLDVFNIRV
jgi:hypothetical protein